MLILSSCAGSGNKVSSTLKLLRQASHVRLENVPRPRATIRCALFDVVAGDGIPHSHHERLAGNFGGLAAELLRKRERVGGGLGFIGHGKAIVFAA